jgi:hypothetical protein
MMYELKNREHKISTMKMGKKGIFYTCPDPSQPGKGMRKFCQDFPFRESLLLAVYVSLYLFQMLSKSQKPVNQSSGTF